MSNNRGRTTDIRNQLTEFHDLPHFTLNLAISSIGSKIPRAVHRVRHIPYTYYLLPCATSPAAHHAPCPLRYALCSLPAAAISSAFARSSGVLMLKNDFSSGSFERKTVSGIFFSR